LYDSRSDWALKQIKDPNGLNTFYEYDAMGRLARIRDNYNKILSQVEYKFNDVVSFPYQNDEISQFFNKTGCPPGYAGGVLYTVPANKYGSFISRPDANQKAQDEINLNGQALANSTGICYPYWSYVPCCGFSCFYSSFALTGGGSVNFSLVIQKSPAGGGSGIQVGTLSGLLFLPSSARSINYNSGGYSGSIQITTTGQVKLYGNYGPMPIQISGTYTL
jgi:YD repeat-containing protein